MASVWRIVAYYLLPVPLILFLLLSIPLPKNIRRGVLLFTTRVFDLPLIGVFKLLHCALFITLAALLGSVRQINEMRALQATAVFATPNMEITHLSKRWRAERNLWMSGFAFAAWLMLASFYREAVKRLQLQERWDEMEKAEPPSDITGAAAPGAAAEAPSAEAMAAREANVVNSKERAADRPASPSKAEPAPLHAVLKSPLSPGGVEMTAATAREGKKEL